MVAGNDVPANGKAEAKSEVNASLAGGELEFEDFLEVFGGDAGSGILDDDVDTLGDIAGGDEQGAFVAHGIEGIGDDVGPDLVQLAADGFGGTGGFVAFFDGYVKEAVGHEVEGVVDAGVDIDAVEAFIDAGVVAEAGDEVSDAPGAAVDVAEGGADLVEEFEAVEGGVGLCMKAGGEVAEFGCGSDAEVGGAAGGFGVGGFGFELGADGALLAGGEGRKGKGAVEHFLEDGAVGKGCAEGVEVALNKIGGAGDGPDGIVEFMGDAGGHLAEGGHFAGFDEEALGLPEFLKGALELVALGGKVGIEGEDFGLEFDGAAVAPGHGAEEDHHEDAGESGTSGEGIFKVAEAQLKNADGGDGAAGEKGIVLGGEGEKTEDAADGLGVEDDFLAVDDLIKDDFALFEDPDFFEGLILGEEDGVDGEVLAWPGPEGGVDLPDHLGFELMVGEVGGGE